MREILEELQNDVRDERTRARLDGSAVRIVIWRMLDEVLTQVLDSGVC
jgi:hypothetical protein